MKKSTVFVSVLVLVSNQRNQAFEKIHMERNEFCTEIERFSPARRSEKTLMYMW